MSRLLLVSLLAGSLLARFTNQVEGSEPAIVDDSRHLPIPAERLDDARAKRPGSFRPKGRTSAPSVQFVLSGGVYGLLPSTPPTGAKSDVATLLATPEAYLYYSSSWNPEIKKNELISDGARVMASVRISPWIEPGVGFGSLSVRHTVDFAQAVTRSYRFTDGSIETYTEPYRYGFRLSMIEVLPFIRFLLPVTPLNEVRTHFFAFSARYVLHVDIVDQAQAGLAIPQFPESTRGTPVPTYEYKDGSISLWKGGKVTTGHEVSGGFVWEFGFFGISAEYGLTLFTQTLLPSSPVFFLNNSSTWRIGYDKPLTLYPSLKVDATVRI